MTRIPSVHLASVSLSYLPSPASPLRYGLVHSVHSSPTGWRNVGNRRDDRPTRREGERWEQRPRSRRSEPRGGRFISPSVRFTFLCLSTGSAASCLTHSVPLPLAAQPGVTNGVRNATRSEMEDDRRRTTVKRAERTNDVSNDRPKRERNRDASHPFGVSGSLRSSPLHCRPFGPSLATLLPASGRPLRGDECSEEGY